MFSKRLLVALTLLVVHSIYIGQLGQGYATPLAGAYVQALGSGTPAG